uniref:Uncharacterized protein n=1 Tax=Solanum tuberosum TaxID=4113 RepID=M1DR83_SOLTU
MDLWSVLVKHGLVTETLLATYDTSTHGPWTYRRGMGPGVVTALGSLLGVDLRGHLRGVGSPMRRADHSATLVGIADQLGDSPLDVVHHRLAPSFSIVVLWVIGRHSTASQNISMMRRLLPFSAELILSFRAQHTRTKGELRPFGDSPSGLGNPQAFIFFVIFSLFVPFCEVVSMLSFNLQIRET